MEYCLEVNNLSKKYNTFFLNDISFVVPKGTIMGMIGENGAGKTTTIKTILNLIKKDSGDIKIFGKELEKSEDEVYIKNQIGVVLDESNFHDTLNVKDVNTILSNVYDNWDKNMFYDLIKKFSLPEKKVIKEFSKGMKMKLSIAAAIAHKPKLLILDEATSGLDPVVRNEILDVFLDFIQDEEHSILMSSHITSDLEKVCDYITFIQNGNLVFSETKDEIMDNYGLVKCSHDEFKKVNKEDYVVATENRFGCELLVKDRQKFHYQYETLTIDRITLEDIMLLYKRGEE